ncbi:DUF3626 domain-containing protein [Lentzea sp. CA-135723]|uniref:DUF3626 domain-containing protein n=1 Tax=Lentzea sp. CA-135723 TaxID=3239950 RepID=UPI003D8F5205
MGERAIAHLEARSSGGPLPRDLRVTLNFHPGRGVLDRLTRDGVYRSQFETGTSNGGLTAHPGGDRWEWESRLFGGAYDLAAPSARPKYGALDHHRRGCGGAPRFGSAHLRLTEDVLDRTTFCYPDSVFDPVGFGTARRFALLDHAAPRDPLDDYVEAGFRLSTPDLLRHQDYRTPESVELGLALARDGILTPDLLDAVTAPPQVIKHLWHHLARFGYAR